MESKAKRAPRKPKPALVLDEKMMPQVAESLAKYTARHLGIDVSKWRAMTEEQRKKKFGERPQAIGNHWKLWKREIKSKRIAVPKSTVPTFNPTRITDMKPPKALVPLPGQMELPIT